MTLPTRNQQIDAVAKFLDSDRNEGRSLKEIATEIVDGYWDAVTPPAPALPLREGMLLKTIVANKAYRVAWLQGDDLWVVPEAGGNGWLGSVDSKFWSHCEEYRPKKRIDGKMVEMTDEMIAEAWSNPDWRVGDKVSLSQRIATYEIIATGPQCVLLRDLKRSGVLNVESNRNLGAYYRKEVNQEW